jgi:hypothetical protein
MEIKPSLAYFSAICLILCVSLAGCAANRKYQQLQDNKRRYPDFQFPDRAPYEGSWTG